MDTNTSYEQIVKDVISQYAQLTPSHGSIRLDTIFDEEQGHYALMQSGWDQGIRVRGNLLYVISRDGKVQIEYDGIGHGIVDTLIKQGIPQKDIVLAYLSSVNG